MDTIKSFCDTALLIDKGHMVEIGPVKRVAQIYENIVNQEIADMKRVQSLDVFVNSETDKKSSLLLLEEDPALQNVLMSFVLEREMRAL